MLRDASNAFLPVGTNGTLNGSTEFIVGYDGEAYLSDLKAQNGG